MTDKALIKEAKKGVQSAQKALYDRYRQVWYMICLRYCVHSYEAMDVLQDALVKIFTKIEQYDESRGNFKVWSSKIVVNENLMYLRKRRGALQFDEISQYSRIEDRGETPIERLSAEMLIHVIGGLPEGYRVIFNMFVMEGMTHKEIATQLNINEGTSKSQLYKAKKWLQQKLEVIL